MEPQNNNQKIDAPPVASIEKNNENVDEKIDEKMDKKIDEKSV